MLELLDFSLMSSGLVRKKVLAQMIKTLPAMQKTQVQSDINKGPLERARMHIIGHGLKGQIETRLSDGLKKVNPGEVDGII